MWPNVLGVWGNVLGCGWRCREVLGELWESVLGCGGYGKILGEVWESVLRCGESKGEMWGEM